jgi:hypothetical protein
VEGAVAQTLNANETVLLVFDSRVFKSSTVVRNTRIQYLVNYCRHMHTSIVGAIGKLSDLPPCMKEPDVHLLSTKSIRLRLQNYRFGPHVNITTKMQALQTCTSGNVPHYFVVNRKLDRIFKFTVRRCILAKAEQSAGAVSHVNVSEQEELEHEQLEQEELLDATRRRRKILREHFGGDEHSFDAFCAKFDECTKPYRSMFLTDVTKNVDNEVFWYRANSSSASSSGMSQTDAMRDEAEWDMVEDAKDVDQNDVSTVTECTHVNVSASQPQTLRCVLSTTHKGVNIAVGTSVEAEILQLQEERVLVVVGLRRMAKTSFALSLVKTRGAQCLFISASGVPFGMLRGSYCNLWS